MTAFETELRSALAGDLNTAHALGAVHTLLRQVYTALDGQGIAPDVRKALDHALTTADGVLDIAPRTDASADGDSDEIQRLVDERTAARKARDFARADAVRDELAARGILLEDTPHGTVWRRR